MEIKQVGLIVAVILILYFVYTYFFSDPTVADLAGMHDAKQLKEIKASELPGNKGSNDFTFSVWIYVNTWNYRYGQVKNILRRASASGEFCPLITLGSGTNNMTISLTYYPTSGELSTEKTHNCTVKNIPLQKWTHVLMSTAGRSLDVYLDGKLVKTCLLPGVAKMDPTAPVHLCPDGGFSGFTSRLRYYARSLNPREVYEIYKEGYSSSWFGEALNRYKLSVQFSKDNNVVNEFDI